MTKKSRRALGWRELLIHAIVTLVAIFITGTAADALVPIVVLASAVILFLRWRTPRSEALTRDDAGALAELEERVRFLESDQARLIELEERLDFAERLLAQRREAERLPPR